MIESARVAEARSRARERVARQRDTLRPFGLAVLVAVAASAASAISAGGIAALAVFAVALAVAIGPRFAGRSEAAQAGVVALLGAAGVALTALEPHGATTLAAATAVWFAIARLRLRLALVLALAVTIALDVAVAPSGASTIVAATLLCALLGLVARFLQQSRAGQEQTELLLAQLEDARDEQLRAAAIEERGRIAGELHDVLAHSLSAAAIQLQGARVLAGREDRSGELRGAIERASALVKDGLANARHAVGALRGDELPGVAQLESLVASFRDDLNVDATLTVEGRVRDLPAETSLALYRGAQEALTNVARYAPGAATAVVLRYADERTQLTVDNAQSSGDALAGIGGGRGLDGMRERVERAGGTMRAGPTATGWRVELDVPA